MTERKFGKTKIFIPVENRLIQTGGGNDSSLLCNSRREIFGSLQMKNLSNLLTNCQAEIQSNCDKQVLQEVLEDRANHPEDIPFSLVEHPHYNWTKSFVICECDRY